METWRQQSESGNPGDFPNLFTVCSLLIAQTDIVVCPLLMKYQTEVIRLQTD
jgi:hypothetical protein